jgi:hypothetical protein
LDEANIWANNKNEKQKENINSERYWTWHVCQLLW